MMSLDRRRLLRAGGSALVITTISGAPIRAGEHRFDTLVLTDSAADTVTFFTPATGNQESITVGVAPWGITRQADNAFVATAGGVAVLDLRERRRTALIPYETQPASLEIGEYRPGGMGIAVPPAGNLLFVGNYLAEGPSRLEVIDWKTETVLGSIATGIRAFDVLASRDGRFAYSVDHDSYTVTILAVETMTATTVPVSPLGDALGLAGFEKPHYAVLDREGRLLLPFQGQVLARLDPATATYESIPLIADTHQHGIAINAAATRVLIVGTGPAGSAGGPSSLTIMDLDSGEQRLVPLDRPHERVAFSSDERTAWLTGGYSFAGGGWDGITEVDLETMTTREFIVGAWPLDILVLNDN